MRLGVQRCAWVDHYDLIIFEGEVVACALEVSCLHEEAREDAFLYIVEVVRACCWHGCELEAQFCGHTDELIADVVGLF